MVEHIPDHIRVVDDDRLEGAEEHADDLGLVLLTQLPKGFGEVVELGGQDYPVGTVDR